MFYEYIENLKTKFYYFRHKNDQFIPAGSEFYNTPKTSSAPSENFSTSFSTTNSTNPFKTYSFSDKLNLKRVKDFKIQKLDHTTRSIILLLIIALISFFSLALITKNYNSFVSAKKAYLLEHPKTSSKNSSTSSQNSSTSSKNTDSVSDSFDESSLTL